jgi:pyruvate-formate lyase-activating enzyme
VSAANLVEIFSSFRARDRVGRSTLFVRFGACDLRCRWCDSPAWKRAPLPDRGSRARRAKVDGPVPLAEVADAAKALASRKPPHRGLTGGHCSSRSRASIAGVARAVAHLLETHGHNGRTRARDRRDRRRLDGLKLASEVERADHPRGAARGVHAQRAAFCGSRCARGNLMKVVVRPRPGTGSMRSRNTSPRWTLRSRS